MKNNQENKEVRVRFAPSPTGSLHIGGARTALFNYLYARRNNGKLILRIEDTDKERSKKEYEDNIMRSLSWLGISWDEGPYRQSERESIYKEYIEKLLKEEKAYYCFCKKEELERMREEQRDRKEPPRYEGKCLSLSKEERERRIEEGKEFVLRLKIPKNEVIEFNDEIKGRVKFDAKDIGGDFVIARSDFSPLYNFVCAIDDFKMQISHVIRGEEHTSNTPRQIIIQKMIGAKTPHYAHISLILGRDKKKLSKRDAAVSLEDYKNEGYLSQAISNFIALLGWHPGGEREIYSLKEMEQLFSLKDCQKVGAIFDTKKLEYMNGQYIRKMNLDDLTKKCIPYLINDNLISQKKDEKEGSTDYKVSETGEDMDFEKLSSIVSLYQERMKKISEIKDIADDFFKENVLESKDILSWKDMNKENLIESLEKGIRVIESVEWEKSVLEEELIKEANTQKDRGRFLWPIRAALTGKKASASPFDVIWVLGRKTSLKRLRMAINALN